MSAPTPEPRPAGRERRRGRRLSGKAIVFIVAGALVLTGGGAAAAFALLGDKEAPAPEAEEKAVEPLDLSAATAIADTLSAPAELPRTAVARAGIGGWSLADRSVVGAVLPEVGNPASGGVSLRVDAPAADAGVVAASAAVALQPETEYTVTASVRSQETYLGPVPVEFAVGGQRFPVAVAGPQWQQVEFSFTSAADAGSSAFEVILNGATTGFGIDDVSVAPASGENLVPNSSFEEVETSYGLLNDSLVFTTHTATLAVSLPEGAVSWTATPTMGGDAFSGQANVAGPLAAVPLEGLPQGHYTLGVTSADGGYLETGIAVVDSDDLRLALDPRFGVGAHVEREGFDGTGIMASALGFGEIRNDITWSRNEKTEGEFVWDPSYEREFPIVHANGMQILGLVVYGNPLYGHSKTPDTPEAIENFGRYAAAIAQHYDVVGLEVFNEFNHPPFNKGACGITPDCYIPLLESVHRQVKAVRPELPIVAGATAFYEDEWFVGLWEAGGLTYADAMSYHPYQVALGNPDDLRGVVAQSIETAKAHGATDLPVWVTELGWSTRTNAPGGGSIQYERQGEVLVRSAVSAFAGGLDKYFWYDLVNGKDKPDDHMSNFGLYEHSPRENVVARAPKLGGFTQALLVSQLDGAAYTASEGGDDAYVELFGDAEGGVRVAWAVGEETSVNIAAKTEVVVTDVYGKVTTIAAEGGTATVPVTPSPVFVHTR